MYDFIYPKIEEKCLIPHLLKKGSWKIIMNLQALKLVSAIFIKKGLELVTSHYSGYETSSEKLLY